jgi:signal transduction histidine kinase
LNRAQAIQREVTKADAGPAVAMAKDVSLARHGWTSINVEGRQHVFGWLQPDGRGNVRGVELELAGLLSRLGGTLPQEFGPGEGYALQDELGRIVHQTGAVPGAASLRVAGSSFHQSPAPVTRLPLASHLIPGWQVVAYLTSNDEESRGGNLVWVGGLLVGVFVLAIVAGGSLLLWQAQRSENEAAQKTSFVANVSHEFKTPLTTIRLYSELLEQGRVRDTDQEADYLRTIGRETQRLARLVNNALDFSRLEQGRKKYARESIDLVAELTRLLDTHEPRVAEAGLALRRSFPEGRVEVATDRDALEQIVLNLIDNACKYAADGGEVLVAIRAGTDGATEISVADRGAGVPVEHRERIFEKFHRVDDALTAEKSGAGLGLSIARQLARGLGGELRFVPRDGGGAEFILSLK